MKQGACVAVEMLLPNKERNSVVLAGVRLVTASSRMVLWLTQRPYIVIIVVLA
jgi:hypothetical protein